MPALSTRMMSFPAVLVLLAGCMTDAGAPAGAPPAAGNEAGILGMSAAECGTYGGSFSLDGSNMPICSLGAPVASFNCAMAGTVAVVGNRFGETFILRGGALEKVAEVPAASGVRWSGPSTMLHSKGDAAVLSTPAGDISCGPMPAATAAGGAGASGLMQMQGTPSDRA